MGDDRAEDEKRTARLWKIAALLDRPIADVLGSDRTEERPSESLRLWDALPDERERDAVLAMMRARVRRETGPPQER